ncbi:hypothetical protein COCMIDRAFT_27805 [Bipolaris oryzae ATCC 44560]|uniref:Uncharacterized protein n=1 Tax=Bipolaris oryzae ATCC 44560 TaxID=930090 RepID=W6Z1C4_COCMI|nr:uncharacterized protein COCMIDRAFT_27805 [Bipolaris oryzae ATCC 44560]EUC43745.1 hypothetical protein COCMIDRAFT_27805 [Bipolaris oryzae ATCC 44560]
MGRRGAGGRRRSATIAVGGGLALVCAFVSDVMGIVAMQGMSEAGTGGPRQILWPGWDAQAQTDLAEAYRVPQAAQCQSTTPSPQLQPSPPPKCFEMSVGDSDSVAVRRALVRERTTCRLSWPCTYLAWPQSAMPARLPTALGRKWPRGRGVEFRRDRLATTAIVDLALLLLTIGTRRQGERGCVCCHIYRQQGPIPSGEHTQVFLGVTAVWRPRGGGGGGKGASFVSPKCFHGASGASTAVSQGRRASPSLRHSGHASPIGCPAAQPDFLGIENAMLLSAVSNPPLCLGPLPARRLVARCTARTRLICTVPLFLLAAFHGSSKLAHALPIPASLQEPLSRRPGHVCNAILIPHGQSRVRKGERARPRSAGNNGDVSAQLTRYLHGPLVSRRDEAVVDAPVGRYSSTYVVMYILTPPACEQSERKQQPAGQLGIASRKKAVDQLVGPKQSGPLTSVCVCARADSKQCLFAPSPTSPGRRGRGGSERTTVRPSGALQQCHLTVPGVAVGGISS